MKKQSKGQNGKSKKTRSELLGISRLKSIAPCHLLVRKVELENILASGELSPALEKRATQYLYWTKTQLRNQGFKVRRGTVNPNQLSFKISSDSILSAMEKRAQKPKAAKSNKSRVRKAS